MNTIIEKVLIDYLHLCRNPLRGKAALTEEFFALLQLPKVIQVMVTRDSKLLIVDTTDIHIQDDDTGIWHNLGGYSIFIERINLGLPPVWKVKFFFLKNEDDTTENEADQVNDYIIHPHITLDDDEDGEINGRLCISQGGFPIDQSIRSGDLATAVSLLLEILGTYHKDVPYRPLSAWPTVCINEKAS